VAEADGLLATFNALLRIAKIESEGRREGFANLDLSALARDVVELYEPLTEAKGQKLELDLNPDIPFRGDRDLLFQALLNLLDNAVKYTPPGGRIRLQLTLQRGGPRLVVADSGPGIPEAARDKVFQRFFRLEESRTSSGNGLGLSLVAAIAKIHGLTLSLQDNQPGLRVVCDFPSPAKRAV
jgi:signal transduction histidine kinase